MSESVEDSTDRDVLPNASAIQEAPVVFTCAGSELAGVLHRSRDLPAPRTGVVVIVGGPQYRIGSHRQFVHLARHLAGAGYAVLRFDYRGLGDSEGEFVGFEGINADITAAVGALQAEVPTVEQTVLFGLCDAASAALLHVWEGGRVAGLVLLNPWVRTEQSEARAYLGHYYAGRIREARSWRRVVRGEVNLFKAATSVVRLLARSRFGSRSHRPEFPQRMLRALGRFSGPVLLHLSGQDLTAAEFRDYLSVEARRSAGLRNENATVEEWPEADHTFSSISEREAMEAATLRWLQAHFSPGA